MKNEKPISGSVNEGADLDCIVRTQNMHADAGPDVMAQMDDAAGRAAEAAEDAESFKRRQFRVSEAMVTGNADDIFKE